VWKRCRFAESNMYSSTAYNQLVDVTWILLRAPNPVVPKLWYANRPTFCLSSQKYIHGCSFYLSGSKLLNFCVLPVFVSKNGHYNFSQPFCSCCKFCCSKKVRKLHLFSTKVAFMRAFDCERLDTTSSFARTSPKAKIFRTSTSNWVRALWHCGTWLGL